MSTRVQSSVLGNSVVFVVCSIVLQLFTKVTFCASASATRRPISLAVQPQSRAVCRPVVDRVQNHNKLWRLLGDSGLGTGMV